jgi:hypothetical protein
LAFSLRGNENGEADVGLEKMKEIGTLPASTGHLQLYFQ